MKVLGLKHLVTFTYVAILMVTDKELSSLTAAKLYMYLHGQKNNNM